MISIKIFSNTWDLALARSLIHVGSIDAELDEGECSCLAHDKCTLPPGAHIVESDVRQTGFAVGLEEEVEIWVNQAFENPLARLGLLLIVLEQDTIFRLGELGRGEHIPLLESSEGT